MSGYARAWFARGTEINLVTKMGRGCHRIEDRDKLGIKI